MKTEYEHDLETPESYHLSERHIYGSSRIGMITEEVEYAYTYSNNAMVAINENDFAVEDRIDVVFTTTLGKRQYELSNHLGNVLSVIGDQKLPIVQSGVVQSFVAYVISSQDYSPFGVTLSGRSWSGEEYRYGFQNQEKDDELWGGAISFKYRVEDVRLGRFLSVDPLLELFSWNSVYSFACNSVIKARELEGSEVEVPPVDVGIVNDRLRTDVEIKMEIELKILEKTTWYVKQTPTRELFSQMELSILFQYTTTNANKASGNKDNCITQWSKAVRIVLSEPNLNLSTHNIGEGNKSLESNGYTNNRPVVLDVVDSKGKVNNAHNPISGYMAITLSTALTRETRLTEGNHIFSIGIEDSQHAMLVIVEVTKNIETGEKGVRFFVVDQNPSISDGQLNDWGTGGKREMSAKEMDEFVIRRSETMRTYRENKDKKVNKVKGISIYKLSKKKES